jgi:hypothetical protein
MTVLMMSVKWSNLRPGNDRVIAIALMIAIISLNYRAQNRLYDGTKPGSKRGSFVTQIFFCGPLNLIGYYCADVMLIKRDDIMPRSKNNATSPTKEDIHAKVQSVGWQLESTPWIGAE